MTDKAVNNFEKLVSIDISKLTEEKTGLTYLSWADAWAQVNKVDPEVSYKVIKHDGVPYICDPLTGYMVFTEVTIFGRTLSCHLPVLNGANKAMKSVPYSYKTKYDTKQVNAASMVDINKAIMRCLTKNIALHGLGLNLYTKEDLTDNDDLDGTEGAQTTAQNNTNPPNQPTVSSTPPPAPDDWGEEQPMPDDGGSNAQHKPTNVTVDKPICPYCNKGMLVSTYADKKTGDYGLYCSGTFKEPKCKYTCSSRGLPRTDTAGNFIK